MVYMSPSLLFLLTLKSINITRLFCFEHKFVVYMLIRQCNYMLCLQVLYCFHATIAIFIFVRIFLIVSTFKKILKVSLCFCYLYFAAGTIFIYKFFCFQQPWQQFNFGYEL